jgi:hypothetical protein
MERIKVAERGFWPGFWLDHSIFVQALKQNYDVKIIDDPRRADLLFEGCDLQCWAPTQKLPGLAYKLKKWRDRKMKIPGKRVYYSSEPYSLPIGRYHGVISSHSHMRDNHFYYPFWVACCKLWKDTDWRHKHDPDADFLPAELTTVRLTSPKKFAITFITNAMHLRFKTAQWLERFGKVDIFGGAVGRYVPSKMAIMGDYKFNLCPENSLGPGYLTEKAVQAKLAGCIPLYWGDPSYRKSFNEKSLINIYEYDCDFERIFNTVDLEEVRHTPLLNELPYHLLPDMAQFLEGVMKAPLSSVF